MKKGIRKRITAFTLAVLLMGTSIQLPVMAAGDCEHHTQHTAECGYVEGVEGSACTHEHGDECYSEATVCVHNHDESCGYAEAVEGSACNHSHDESCGEDGVACAHGHDESCGYKEAQEGTICTHVCSSENGCITLEENCIHVDHDENCGYREAVEGTPCAFSCDDCTSEEAVQENENQKDEQREEQKEEQKDEEDTDICICEDKCTAETINEECPVCSLEEADLALCIGEEAEDEEDTNNCICETDDLEFHATNCPAYVPSENPVCTCAEKCTEDTLNVWCEVCGLQGVEFCEGEEVIATYDEVVSYDIRVGGVGMNDGDYLACDAVSVSDTKPASGGYAYYMDGTLTLNNYTYEGVGYQYEEENEDGEILLSSAAIYCDSDFDLTIVLEGNNSFTNTMGEDAGEGYGIWNNMSNLTITGIGLLTINSGNDGIRGEHDVIIENGTVIIHSGDDGILAEENSEITGGTVKIDAESDGIYAIFDVEITGGMVEINAGSDGIDVGGAVEIIGGTVKIDAGDNGIEASENAKITGGIVEINASDDGIDVVKNAEITGGIVEINASDDGIDVVKNVEITGGIVEISASDDGIYAYDYDGEIIEGTVEITGGTVKINAVNCGIYSGSDDVVSGKSTVEIKAEYGIYAQYGSIDIDPNLNILLPEGGTKEDFASATQVLITVACEHEYSDSYIYNDTHHWKKCTKNCSSNEYPESFGTNYVEHIVDETTGKCVCGYDSSRIADVYVGGFGLDDGEYLSNGGGIGHEVPSGGYAYYKDGTLTLNNYSYTGKGYSYLDEYFSTLYSNQDLTIQLEGTNSLKNIKLYGDGITAIEADLVFNGSGTLNIQADNGIYTYGKYNEEDAYSGKGGISINGGTLNIKADYYGVWCDGDITVTDGTLTVNSGEEGITSVNGNISVNGGNNDITAKSHGMEAMEGNIYFNGGNTVVNGDVAVNASGGITLGQGITVLEPVGAKVAYVTVSIGDEDGERYVICKDDGKTVATSVKIAAKDNSGGSSNTPPASGDNNNGGSSNTPPVSGDNNSGGSSNTPPASDNNSKEDVNPLVTFGNLRGNVGNTTLASDEEDKDSEIPFIKNEEGKQGWDVIRDEVVSSNDGTTLTVDMNGATVVPGDIFNDIKGKDITMVFDLGNGVTWSVNGLSISSDNIGDIDFEVKVGDDANDTIPVEVRNTVTGEKSFVNISLSYEGDFGFTAVLSVNLESGNAGLFANLFYYNEQTREMEFICSDEIAEDGTVELTFTHASEYTMVIDEVAFNAPASSEEGILPEIGVEAERDNAEADNATDTTDVSDPLVMASKDADSAWWIVLLIAVLAVAGIAGFVIYSKKNKSE